MKKEMTEFFSVSAKGAALKGNNGITDSYIYSGIDRFEEMYGI